MDSIAHVREWCRQRMKRDAEKSLRDWLEFNQPDQLFVCREFLKHASGDTGGFAFTSKKMLTNMKNWYDNNPPGCRVLECDGTYKLHHQGWVLFMIGTHDGDNGEGGHSFWPMLYCFMKTELAESVKECCLALKSLAEEALGIEMKPNVCISDCSDAIRNGVEMVWPEIGLLTCYSHIVRKVTENKDGRIRGKANKEKLKYHIELLHWCKSEFQFDAMVTLALQVWREIYHKGVFADWFESEYLCARWKCWYIGASPFVGVLPNANPIESHNRQIKRNQIWKAKQKTEHLLNKGFANILLFDGRNSIGTCQHILQHVPFWAVVAAYEYLQACKANARKQLYVKLKSAVVTKYNLQGTAYLVNSSQFLQDEITATRAKTYLDCLQFGKLVERDPHKAMKSMKHDVLGLHLVLVSERRADELPGNCGCKSFQKHGQCSHATFIAHVEKLLDVDLAEDFKKLPENKKRGRKTHKSKTFGHCLQRE